MKPVSDIFQIAADSTFEPAGPGCMRQLLGYNGELMLVKAVFSRGGVGALHSHPHSQATYVAAGAFEVTVGDTSRVIAAGDGFFVEPGALHGCVCLEDGILIDAFNPARTDFLQGKDGLP
ncbi:MAG: cupin domain-containing protein [Tannerellaceae bacterium]|nr:cupin domain-containing protein [Tannerellaceae bacterium]